MANPPDLDENLLIEELSQKEEYHLSKGEQKVMDEALRKSVEIVEPLKSRPAKTARKPIKRRTPEEKAADRAQLMEKLAAREAEWMEKHLESLADQRSEAISEFDRVSRLRSEFPDLRVETDRWKKTRYKARSANTRVTNIEFRRTCGCCPDPGILAMPYMETTLGRVYSDPFRMEIGEGRTYTFISEFHGWEDKYRAAGIPEEIVAKIRSYLDAELASGDDDDDD